MYAVYQKVDCIDWTKIVGGLTKEEAIAKKREIERFAEDGEVKVDIDE